MSKPFSSLDVLRSPVQIRAAHRRRSATRADAYAAVNKADLLAEVNSNIRRVAADVDSDHDTVWDFVCECGSDDCFEQVGLPLARYDELKNADAALLAPGHPLRKARDARQQAGELKEEATALRNEAQTQRRRSRRIAGELDEG